MLRQTLVGLAVVALVASANVAHARVDVNVGINLPGPPSLVIIPQTPVAYAPAVPANLFFYGGHYYVFANNGWDAPPPENGPRGAVAPTHIPPPLLPVAGRGHRAPPPRREHRERG